ncbi:11424_t:CDS:2 [Paraglomus brasilianum]|uniref:11424_t:CDS:1 n=1 Tax=Paraglomus brasilianum TaxID=144538 RepID=A0A9N9DFG1_9GLOM|nr:11424_t:CDS:2 [Paraglomus brasilianum]
MPGQDTLPVIVGSESTFDDIIANETNKLIVVDFYADWCGPCRMIAPLFVKLASEHIDVKFLKVDVDALTGVAAKHNVTAMPTFKYFYNQKEVCEIVGAQPQKIGEKIEELKKKIECGEL